MLYEVIHVLEPVMCKWGANYPPEVAYQIETWFVEAWKHAFPRGAAR